MRCWQCGVEPTERAEVTTLGEPEPVYLPVRWPPGDHEHAVTAPSPEQIADDAYAAGQRILAGWGA